MTLAGRLFNKRAPLQEKLRFIKIRAELSQTKFVFFVSELIISAEWHEQALRVFWGLTFWFYSSGA